MDVACSTGEATRLSRRLDRRAKDVNLSSEMIEMCRAKHPGDRHADIMLCDTELSTLPDDSFDGILCSNLIRTLTPG